MLSMKLASGDRTAVSWSKRFWLAPARQRDLASDHHDPRVPFMRVIGVHLTRFQTAIEHLVTLTPQIGFKIALVH
jgi:hypothetical protein